MLQISQSRLILQTLSRRVRLQLRQLLPKTEHPRHNHKDTGLRPTAPPSGQEPKTAGLESLLNQFKGNTASIWNKPRMLISIDGNISSGKSSLVAKIVEYFDELNSPKKQNGVDESFGLQNGHHRDDDILRLPYGKALAPLEVEIIPEPLQKWCNLRGYNLLDMFYKEPTKYCFVFEHYVQLTRLADTLKAYNSAIPDPSTSNGRPKVQIMERSLQSSRFCFYEMARKSKHLEPAEFTVLDEWYKWLESNMSLDLDLIIYLRTDPGIAYSRMTSRARTEESTCPLSYLSDLHETYEDWLIRHEKNPSGSRQHIIVLDANKTREEVTKDCIDNLTKFLLRTACP